MQKPLKILAIEDRDPDLQLTLRAVHRAGWETEHLRVDRLEDLKSALDDAGWDLALMDCHVPGLDFGEGLALVIERRPLLPIILVSGSIGEERAIDMIRWGAWDLVLKERLDRIGPAIERSLREANERAALAAAEAELLLNETRLTLAVAAADMGVWEWDLTTRRYYWSAECSAIAGRELEGIGPNQFISMIHPDDQRRVRAAISRNLEEHSHFELEFRMIPEEGGERWIYFHGSPDFYDANMPVQFTGVMQDITARKRTEVQVRHAGAMFEGTQEAVLVTDRDGTILAANPAFGVLMGYEPMELIGQNTRLFRSEHHPKGYFRSVFDIVGREGGWDGEMWLRRRSGELVSLRCTITGIRDQAGQISGHVASYRDLSQIKETQEQVEFLTHHDPLTQLPNRAFLLSRLQSAISRAQGDQSCGAVLLLGLERFREINDGYGHDIGDAVLQMVADRCRIRLRDTDLIARVGGDEFMVVLENMAMPETAGRVAQDLINSIARTMQLEDGRELFVGSSIGISVFPADGHTAELIVRNADSALSLAKQKGRGFNYSSQHLLSDAASRVQLHSALRRGIDRREFLLHYQPLVETGSKRNIGVEALLRWAPPDRDMIPPDKFIPMAEETGLIVPIGAWVLDTACRQLREWQAKGMALDIMAVNLSPVQFKHPDLLKTVRDALNRSGLAPEHLELEITEGALMDGDESESKLQALKSLGVRLSIDDFGTGYSSLAYLKRFPIDKLKVDRSFVRDVPKDRAAMEIVTAVISLAKSLHLETLAEGVETQEQLEVLRGLDCQYAQGYLFSRPLEPAVLARHLSR